MKNKYSYIGSFDVSSGNIDIVDPYINNLSVEVEKIPIANEKMVKVRGALNGVYDAYHIVNDEDGIIIDLLVIHGSYNIENVLKKEKFVELGYTSSALSGAVVLVDERHRLDSDNSYYSVEMDAYYEGKMILDKLSEMTYSDETKNNLKQMVQDIIKNESQPKGTDILNVLQGEVAWSGFSSFGVHSSHWSSEVINRVRSSHVNGTVIKGGVACKVRYPKGGYHNCSCYRNSRGDVCAIKVDLSPAE
jgi:hypothetical protein